MLFVKKIKLFFINSYFAFATYVKYLFSKNTNRLYTKNDRKEKIIISLTTYSKRINTVFLAIESIFNQTIKADKVILWLDKDEFTLDTLPKSLKKQIKQGLSIEFCENLKSYKKLVPALKKYPNDILITADDDLIYQKTWIQKLYNAYLQDNNAVYCYYSFKFLNNDFEATTSIDKLTYLFNYVGTGAGALFPPHILPNDILNEELFMKLAPTHDDLFISVLLLKYNIKLVNVNKKYTLYRKVIQRRTIPNTQDIGLFLYNYYEKGNRTQLLNLLKHYNITLQKI